jgi:hypothetical protein
MKMAECEILSTCVFFNDEMANMPATAAIYKERYCQGDNLTCARYLVFKAVGRLKVPSDLFPPEEKRAKKIIAAV